MKEKILKLRLEGKSYEEIAILVPCAVSTVWYYCTKGAKKNRISRTQTNRQKFRTEIKIHFGGKCSICGYDKCLDSLVFHHKERDEKEHNVGHLIHIYSKKKAYAEAEKCQLVCANCHGEIHAAEGYQ